MSRPFVLAVVGPTASGKTWLGIELAKKYGGEVESSEIGLPVSGNGLVLPCGASGRWSR